MKITHVLTGLVLAGTLSITSLSVMAKSNASAPATWSQTARIAQHMDARIEHIATLLQLSEAQKSSPAWKNYATALRDLGKHAPWKNQQPSDNADAATLARTHADAMTQMASKLSTLADATSALEAMLNDAQRKVLDQMAHKECSMHFRHHGFDHGSNQ